MAPATEEVRSTCPYCGVGCGVLASVRAGRVTGIRGDPDHPTNRGGLCAKGQRLAETLRTGDRLLQPMRRPVDAAGRFERLCPWEPVTWDDALSDAARRLQRIQGEHGKDAVAFYLSGQLLIEDYYVANKLVKGFLGTNNVDTNSRLCMASAAVAYKLAFGSDAPPGCYEDTDHATCVAFFGSNAADTHPIVFGRLRQARERTGARWIVIDPRRTATAEAADLHLAITPGSDVALLLAMLRVGVSERLVDPGYVRRHTAGYDEAVAVAMAWTPERAAEVCGVPAGAIHEAGRLFAGSRNTMSLWCQGLNQSVAAVDKNLALINLHLATGQIGRPGTGPFSLTGQANAMGGREVGGMATELAAHRQLANEQDREEVQAFWGSGPIAAERGLTAVELVDALLEGRVRAVWIAGTNPVASLPDAAGAEAALRSAELVVVQELYHPTDTSVFADLLLPAAGWAEKTGTLTSSERRVALAAALVPPPGEARADWRIFADLAGHLGHQARFAYRDAADVFDEHAELTGGRTCDMRGISHARLRREGSLQWPCPTADHPGQQRRFTDGVFATPDRRARFHPTPFRPTAESPSPRFPLRLTTVRDANAWHTQTKTGKVAALRRHNSVPLVMVHPSDAHEAGVGDDAAAHLESRRGRWRGRVVCSDSVPRGTVAIPFHWSPLWNRGAWTNRMTPAALDPRSLQPELKHTAVRLMPARSSLDGLRVVGGEAARWLAEALTEAGVQGVRSVGWDSASPAGAWCVVVDGSTAGERWVRGAGLPQPVVVDATGRILGHDCGYAVGDGVVTASGLRTDSDPTRLARALVAEGDHGPRALARFELDAGEDGRMMLRAGEPEPGRDDEAQGVERLRVQDTASGLEVSWRLASGEVLGVEAVGEPEMIEQIARAWLEDRSPEEVRTTSPGPAS